MIGLGMMSHGAFRGGLQSHSSCEDPDNNNEDRDDGSATEDNGCFEPFSFLKYK